MARTTKQLSGAGKDKFLRALVERAAAEAAGSAGPIAEALAHQITEVRVRRDAWLELTGRSEGDRVADTLSSEPERGPPPVVPAVDPPVTAGPAAFDPFAFSAVAVLTRKGRSGLASELSRIERAEDLRQLAEAQHLSLPDGLADADGLREALIAAAELRIAERRAAAS